MKSTLFFTLALLGVFTVSCGEEDKEIKLRGLYAGETCTVDGTSSEKEEWYLDEKTFVVTTFTFAGTECLEASKVTTVKYSGTYVIADEETDKDQPINIVITAATGSSVVENAFEDCDGNKVAANTEADLLCLAGSGLPLFGTINVKEGSEEFQMSDFETADTARPTALEALVFKKQ